MIMKNIYLAFGIYTSDSYAPSDRILYGAFESKSEAFENIKALYLSSFMSLKHYCCIREKKKLTNAKVEDMVNKHVFECKEKYCEKMKRSNTFKELQEIYEAFESEVGNFDEKLNENDTNAIYKKYNIFVCMDYDVDSIISCENLYIYEVPIGKVLTLVDRKNAETTDFDKI